MKKTEQFAEPDRETTRFNVKDREGVKVYSPAG